MFSSEGSGVESEMLFTTVGAKDSLVERVVANIQQLIVDGQLAPGTRLPPFGFTDRQRNPSHDRAHSRSSGNR